VLVVDRRSDRLRLAEEAGATAVDDSQGDHVERILDLTDGGADKGCECVGYQAHDPQGVERPEATMNDLVASVKATGGIGVVGVFLPQDDGAPTELTQEGKLPFDFGQFWFKGQRIGTGQANVKAYNRRLGNLIHHGRARPSFIVSHELPLAEAADAYRHFDDRDPGWTKVVLKP
ncbi:zinc-binding dehydrogenase, partial [Streptomyces sp. NPDC058427]